MAKFGNVSLEEPDVTDSLGRVYIILLFISGIVWGFLAVNNQSNPDIFKISLVYSILLILGLLGVGLDRVSDNLGLDSRLWSSKNLGRNLVIALIVSMAWYLLFLRGGFSVAVPQAVASPLFVVADSVKFFLVTVLGPLAENLFFFGVVNFTFILFIRETIQEKNKAWILAMVVMATYLIFNSVPFSLITLSLAAISIIVSAYSNNKTIQHWGPVFASAFIVGGNVFPIYHSSAYQLNEQNFVAAMIFGILMCLLGYFAGMLVVDVVHTFNNVAVMI